VTLLQSIDSVVEWLKDNVCGQITLKLPDDDRNDNDYGVKFVSPVAFPLYVPGKDRIPPSVPAPIPSVCVQLMEGDDDLQNRKRQLNLRLCLACWNPGTHGDEYLHPRTDATKTGGFTYYQGKDGANQTYSRNMDGWRDSFNFADLVLREITNAEYIAGHRLMKENSIKYGLFTEDGNIWDYYPYWHSWITFTLECGVVSRTPEIYKDLL